MKAIKITEDLTMVDEGHVGGFIIQNDPATFTPNLWEYICKFYSIKSVIDVGCGMGYALEQFKKHVDTAVGVDGSDFVRTSSHMKDDIIFHDFTKGELTTLGKFDLCWSSEFVEHVEEEFVHNFLKTFALSKFLAITYAGEGQEGFHHVNCKSADYWINLLKQYGFEYLPETTILLRGVAHQDALLYNPVYKDNHFYNRGLFFEKSE